MSSEDPLILSFSPQARMRAFLNARHLGVASAPKRAGRELVILSGHIRKRIWLGEEV
jgi:hypothetical protein